jgi:hypothetical protein
MESRSSPNSSRSRGADESAARAQVPEVLSSPKAPDPVVRVESHVREATVNELYREVSEVMSTTEAAWSFTWWSRDPFTVENHAIAGGAA